MPNRKAQEHAGADTVPDALGAYREIEEALAARRAAIFLDYDGTLTPIVARPDLAVLPEAMRDAVRALAEVATVAVVSGRDRADVERLVKVDGLVYAGSHGFDIAGPGGLQLGHAAGAAVAGAVQEAARRLADALRPIGGALVEPKRYAVAVHYRQVAEQDVAAVEAAVDLVLRDCPALKKTLGKAVFELRPRLDWDKGRAVDWLLETLGLAEADVLPFYLGDDTTDEDAFSALRERGIGIFVGRLDRPTAARYRLDDTEAVRRFLGRLTATLKERRQR